MFEAGEMVGRMPASSVAMLPSTGCFDGWVSGCGEGPLSSCRGKKGRGVPIGLRLSHDELCRIGRAVFGPKYVAGRIGFTVMDTAESVGPKYVAGRIGFAKVDMDTAESVGPKYVAGRIGFAKVDMDTAESVGPKYVAGRIGFAVIISLCWHA